MKKFIIVSLLSLLFAPFVANASLNTNLYYGLQQNSDVTQLQNFLHDKGFLTANATGNFFSLTLRAVRAYQTSAGINPTGYVGTLTKKAINDALTVATNDSATSLQSKIKLSSIRHCRGNFYFENIISLLKVHYLKDFFSKSPAKFHNRSLAGFLSPAMKEIEKREQ